MGFVLVSAVCKNDKMLLLESNPPHRIIESSNIDSIHKCGGGREAERRIDSLILSDKSICALHTFHKIAQQL